MYKKSNGRENAVALLDSGCLLGNWVSARKVQQLGWKSDINKDDLPRGMISVNNQAVTCKGSIMLDWIEAEMGIRVHSTHFYVTDADHVDVIFGAKFLFDSGLLSINRAAIAPLTPHTPMTKGKWDIEFRRVGS